MVLPVCLAEILLFDCMYFYPFEFAFEFTMNLVRQKCLYCAFETVILSGFFGCGTNSMEALSIVERIRHFLEQPQKREDTKV